MGKGGRWNLQALSCVQLVSRSSDSSTPGQLLLPSDTWDVYINRVIPSGRRSGDRRAGKMSVSSATLSLWHRSAKFAEYNEDTQCTICNATVLDDRYKCVSCTKFDLCKPCTSFGALARSLLIIKVTAKSRIYTHLMLSYHYLM